MERTGIGGRISRGEQSASATARAWGASARAGNVKADLARTLAEIGNGRDLFPEHTTLAEYAAEWLEHKRADGLRPTTALR